MALTPRSTLTLKTPDLKCSNRKVPLLSATIYIITSYTINCVTWKMNKSIYITCQTIRKAPTNKHRLTLLMYVLVAVCALREPQNVVVVFMLS